MALRCWRGLHEEQVMKAVLCHAYGPPETLAIEDIASPVPRAGQAVVSVHAAALNFPDTLIIENRYQYRPPLPFSPGAEVAGTVKAIGPGVAGFAAGDRVIAVCGFGGFAEEVATDAANLVRIPDAIPMDAAAALAFTYGTTQYALKDRGDLRAGETLLVLGAAGGTGLSAVEIGKLMGARVIAAASSAEKLDLCRRYGADEVINYATEDLRDRIKALTGGHGVDVVYDPVGGGYAQAALRSLAWKGRHLVIGFTSGEIPQLPANMALIKGSSIVGVFYGQFRQKEPARAAELLDELAGWLAEGRIRPAITSKRPLEDAREALREMADRKVLGKIVLTTELGRAGQP
jgi:NADPH2:quinone reductase